MTNSASQTRNSTKVVTTAAYLVSFGMIVGLLYFSKVVLVPVALAAMLAFVLTPVVTRLHGWGLGRTPAVLATIALSAVLLAGILAVVSIQLGHLAADLPNYQENIKAKIAIIKGGTQKGPIVKLREMGRQILGGDGRETEPSQTAATDGERTPAPVAVAPVNTEEGFLTKALGPILAMAPVIHFFAEGFLVLILAIFMLINREDVRNRLVSFATKGSLTATTKALNEAGSRISRYLTMQLMVNGFFGLMVAIGLTVIGIPYAPLWGLGAAILRYVPYVGAWLAAIPPLAISFAAFPGWSALVAVLSIFVVLEIITGNVVEPSLYGHGTGVSEIALLISATFWAWVWGPVGLILATPLTVCLVVMGKYVPPLAFFDRLLGDRPALQPYVEYLQRLLARDKLEAATVVRSYLHQNSPESIYDRLFIPALALTREDRTSGGMVADDEKFVLHQTSELMKEVGPLLHLGESPFLDPSLARTAVPTVDALLNGDTPQGARPDVDGLPQPQQIAIFGLPAHHEVDELTLQMLHQLILPLGLSVKVLSTRLLPADLLEEVRIHRPQIVFVGAVPPGGMPQACFLCESLRASFPDLGIVVGYWGFDAQLDEVIVNLRSAGANYVTTTLLGARSHIISMLGRSPEPDVEVQEVPAERQISE